MPVTSSTSRVQYNCNGSTTGFAFTFGVGDSDEIQVIYTDNEGTETTLTETTDYTVSATNDDYSSGGTVTTVDTYDEGTTITIIRNIPLTQDADFTEGMPTLYETFEQGLDKLTRIAQQHKELLDRCLIAPSSESSTVSREIPTATDRASCYLAFDADGEAIASTGTPGAVAVTSYMETVLDDETASAARTTLGLGTIATQDADDVDISGGTIAGVTVTTATITSPTITGGTITGMTDITVADGGTGASSITANSVILGNGTGALNGNLVAPGTSGQALVSNGTIWAAGSPAALSTASGSAPSYSARAWVNFNGSGTVAIRASGNVTSITDNGTGDYTINFTTALPDTNYCAMGSVGDDGKASPNCNFGHSGDDPVLATTSVDFYTITGGSTPSHYDCDYCFVAIYR